MSTPAYLALTAAREALTDIESRLASLSRDHDAATREAADADAELTRQLGAEQIGEPDIEGLVRARNRHEKSTQAIRSIAAGRAVLTARLPTAQLATKDAELAFSAEAADLIAPVYSQLVDLFRSQAAALAATYSRLSQVATVRGRVTAGVLTGESLLRAAGNPTEQIQRDQHVSLVLGFLREPRRLHESEILARIAPAAVAAE